MLALDTVDMQQGLDEGKGLEGQELKGQELKDQEPKGQSTTDDPSSKLHRLSKDSKQEQRKLLIQLVGADYWDRLIKAGIPKKQARRIAAAIAKYDIAQRPPKPYQKKLIHHYCSQVCRAKLWRSRLLLDCANA